MYTDRKNKRSNVMDKEEYENIWFNRIAYQRTHSSSEDSLESIVSHASQEESTTQKQPWSKEIEALSYLPGGDIALSLIPTLHGDVLQKVLEEFQCVTFNKNEDLDHSISCTSADKIEQKTILVDENRPAATTAVQLLARWPDTCLLISSWLNHVKIVEALLERDVPFSTSDNDGRTSSLLHPPCITSTNIEEKHDFIRIPLVQDTDRKKRSYWSKTRDYYRRKKIQGKEWTGEVEIMPCSLTFKTNSESSLESIICHDTRRDASQDESTTQKQPWSKPRADVDVRNNALFYAVLNNAVDCVEALLQAGACPNSQVHTTTPLHVAATLGNVHCIKLLLKHKADVTIEMGTTKLTPLLLTAEKGNAECTKLLLDAGASIETRNSSGQTAMHLATLAQSVETINILISAGAKVNAEDDEGRTPLHAAIANTLKSSEMVKILIQAGASVGKTDKCGYTPLHIAASLGNVQSVDTINILISAGAKVNAEDGKGRTPLHAAIANTLKSSEIVKILIQAGASVDKADKCGCTPLHIAASLGNVQSVEMIKMLINARAKVNAEDDEGRTPLHAAVAKTLKSSEIFKILIQTGASVDKADKCGCTPLHIAASLGNVQSVETIKMLINARAKVNAEDDEGRTPLHAAVAKTLKSSEIVKILIKAGASVNKADKCGCTPLHIAASLGNVQSVETINMLINARAKVNAEDDEGRTPLHAAVAKTLKSSEIVKILIKAGASVDKADKCGYTPLHIAASLGNVQSVETKNMLISADAKVNVEDHEGRTPLHAVVAKTLKSKEIVKILIQAGATINKADNSGYTPLHFAALNEDSHSVMILLSKGGDMTARTKGGITALSFIIRRTPDVFSRFVARLNQAISLHDGQLGDTDCELRVDFKSLVPSGSRNETDLMLCLVEVGQGHILKHPLCESFLHLKWKRIRIFFVLSLLFHLIFVAFFTGFVCAKYVWNEEAEKLKSRVLFWSVITIICLFVSKEIFQITYGICYYIKRWENWLKWSVIVASSIILIFPQSRPSWQYHVAAVGILLAWIELMMVIGYFPMFGLYVQMFKRVSINFFKFLAAYFCLLIGFSLSFNVLHKNYEPFANPLISLFKTVIMMSGELDFKGIFFHKDNKNKDVCKDALEYPGTAHIMFLCFVILVTVILMNLMIGLAVSDIQELRRRAGFERLVRHTEVIARFENMLFSKLLDYICACKIIEACRKNTLLLHSLNHAALHIRPNDPNEKRLPRDLILAVNRLISEQKARRMTLRGTSSPQNVPPNKSCKTQQGVQQREQSTAAKRIRGRVEETHI